MQLNEQQKVEAHKRRRAEIDLRERVYFAELREKYVGNENAATILRGLAEAVENLCESLTPLVGWQIDCLSSDDLPKVVGSDGPTKIVLVDGQVLENIFVVAYLPAGAVVTHWDFTDTNEGRRIGNEFIPYHRIKSIFERASSFT